MNVDWRKSPPLTTLRAFEATARLGGYSAAARALNVTPAAIAQQVRKLEAEVEAALVRREGRGLALTEAGQQLARPLNEAFSQIFGAIEDLKHQQAARGVQVSTTDYFANAAVLPKLGEFWKAHPGVQVSFTPEGNPQPIDTRRFDIVIRGAAPNHDWGECRAIPLLTTKMIIAGAPALVGSGDADLASLPWIADHTIGEAVFEDMIRRAGCDPDAITRVDPGSARLELEAGVMGYGLLAGPEIIMRRHLKDGSLRQVCELSGMTGVYSAILAKGPMRAPVRAFLDWLIEACRAY
ncbi:MAG: LysR family transcriptional regulator [Rhodobacteraceae bacterium]|nr:LysR family transcriptional regulator [Paracoccaceae bacterium]